MNWLIFIGLFVLFTIFFQDVKQRSIWWFLPPALFVIVFFITKKSVTPKAILANILFLVAMISLLSLYLRVRYGKKVHLFRDYFGWGDALFLGALTPLLPFPLFVYFFTFGTVIVLFIHLVVNIFKSSPTIPYAGYFSLVTITYLLVLYFKPHIIQQLSEYGRLG